MNPTGRGWVDIPIALAAALAAYLFLWRKGIQPVLKGLRKLGHTADKIIHAAEVVPELHSKVEVLGTQMNSVNRRVTTIEEELKPNGGSTIRDAVDRIEKRVDLDPT